MYELATKLVSYSCIFYCILFSGCSKEQSTRTVQQYVDQFKRFMDENEWNSANIMVVVPLGSDWMTHRGNQRPQCISTCGKLIMGKRILFIQLTMFLMIFIGQTSKSKQTRFSRHILFFKKSIVNR